MILLNLYGTYRNYLEKRGAICTDENGDETLVGLNRSESMEYIAITDGSISTPLPQYIKNPERFLELSDRHELARPEDSNFFYLKTSRFF